MIPAFDSAGFGEAVLQHDPDPTADQMASRRQGHGREAALFKQDVEDTDQIGSGLDQGAVEIEGEGDAVQGRMPHGPVIGRRGQSR